MRIVVTGGTGFVGRALVARLVARGHEVVVWTRDVERARLHLPALCEAARWEPHAPLDPGRLRGVDVVVHLAGESVAGGRWTDARKREMRASRVATSQAIVSAIAAQPREERPRALVAASAIGYYGDRGDEVLTERSAAGSGFLAELCRDWEAAIAAAGAHGARTASIRIGVVLGKDGGALAAMLPPFRLGLGGRVGSGKQWTSWIHLHDVVELFAFAIESPAVDGVLNGVAPEPVTNAELTRELARVLGRPAVLPVPARALELLLGEMAGVLLASQRVVPEAAQRLGFSFRFPRLDAALADLLGDPAHELVFEQWVPRPPEEVFPFFSDARNLEKLTPGFLRFSVLEVTPPELGEGTVIDYKLSLRGIPMRWRSVIEAWDPPRSFTDRQTRGPYGSWRHTHEFEPVRGGTLLRDRIRYTMPAGALGETVAGGFVRRDVERIFAFRRARIAELFGGEPRDATTAPAG